MPLPKQLSIIITFKNIGILIFKISLIIFYEILHKFLGVQVASKETVSVEKEDNHHTKQKIINAKDITEIANASGYIIREHVVKTKDDYLLVIHKLEKTPGQVGQDTDKVVYFHHGLLTNSELFLLGSNKNKTLPYLLLDLGYEVWLGNNRGNKYSRKHLKLSVSDSKFWDYSLDEYALYDIPDTIDYIRSLYKPNTKITYIGFSQGCSQLLASLSLNPDLNSKLKLFIGLSPAIIPQNLNHPIFRIIVKQTANDNNFLYSLFGTRAILPSVSFWSYIMGSKLYEKVVDKSLVYLFGWSGQNISSIQKEIGYPHMFSNSSVKSLTHWFQIINAKRFQMYDETCGFGMSNLSTLSKISKLKGHRVAPFPIAHHLNVPMLLFYGDSDILVDIESTRKLILDQNIRMKRNLIGTIICPGYEHMDTLWGNNVYEDVFKQVIEVMENKDSDDTPILEESLKQSYFDIN